MPPVGDALLHGVRGRDVVGADQVADRRDRAHRSRRLRREAFRGSGDSGLAHRDGVRGLAHGATVLGGAGRRPPFVSLSDTLDA